MLCPEMFKADPVYSASTLLKIFDPICKCRKVPEDWTKASLSKCQKGARSDCNNWCDITKILAKTKLYKSCVVPVLLYGAECWNMTDTDINKHFPYKKSP